ncbi:MAG: hypothetical protein IKW18_08880 [Clostridia bacterium]|nr:hypothetical protein [Clostridia bacterium]
MKKYDRSDKTILAVIAVVCVCALIAGVILVIAKIPLLALKVCLIVFGLCLSAIFVPAAFCVRRHYLIIDEEKIDFPIGCSIEGKCNSKRTVVRFDEIRSVKTKFYEGDTVFVSVILMLFGMPSMGDTYFYTLNLKDNRQIEVNCIRLYGNKAEKEIFEMICQSVEKCGGCVYKDPNGE